MFIIDSAVFHTINASFVFTMPDYGEPILSNQQVKADTNHYLAFSKDEAINCFSTNNSVKMP